ncbi:MAG: hypothetical protein GX145_00550 [Clostridiaceae bacterium]|jgi:hypothetical protein|nr:hypothetical protein [Bacillota bacterium]NLN51290.1 hypothetical protein [Clostridiaceae bacterium]
MFLNKLKSQIVKGKFVCTLLIICGVLLSSCSRSEKEQTIDQDQSDLVIESSEQSNTIQDRTNSQSAALRVYWQTRTDYNPLNTFDYSGRAAFQLMFRSILQIDKSNVLRMDLARNVIFVPEKSLYRIELTPGITFSNGQLISSADCAASIIQYRENLQKFINPEAKDTVEEELLIEEEEQISDQTQDYSERFKDYPDLFKLHQFFSAREISEFIESKLLEKQLELLNLIKDIKIIDNEKFEILLVADDQTDPKQNQRDDEQEVIEDPNIDQETLEADQITETETEAETPENHYEFDPGLLSGLTMPIIPADQVNSTGIISITSDRYTYQEFDSGKLILQSVDPDKPLQQIELISYASTADAMSALVNDQLDLILLTEENYNLYSKHGSQNIISFPGQRYYYFSFGSGTTINDPEIQEQVLNIWQVRDDLASDFSGDQSKNQLPLQYTDQAISAFGLFEFETTLFSDNKITDLSHDQLELRMIVPETNLESDWAFRLREKLLNLNLDLKITYIPLENYPAAIAEGDYDLALNRLDLAYPMSIFDSYEQISSGITERFTEEDNALAHEIDVYFNSVDRHTDPKIFSEKSISYRTLIFENFNELNILGIGFAPTGIFLSKNVEGTTESYLAEPYLGVEELWVWQ